MTFPLAPRLEKGLVLLLLLSFALPLPLGWLLLLPSVQVPATAWLRNVSLAGVQIAPPAVGLSRAAILSARYQESVAHDYNYHFAGRELLIRLIDEFYLRVFHRTFVTVLVGPRQALTEATYAAEYCLMRGQQPALATLVADLRRLQDFCDARNIPFVLVITPSKSAVYPETLPAAWLRRYRPGPRAYDELLPLLRASGIHYVDGHRIAAELKPKAAVPVFPLGGIHWSQPTALATANAVLEFLASKGLDVQPIQNYRTSISDQPEGMDRDLADLINIVVPMHYPVETVTVLPSARQSACPPNVVFIGGSFFWSLLAELSDSRQFSELVFYYYYRVSQVCWIAGDVHTVGSPTPPPNFATDIFAADGLVLETNEERLDEVAPHLRAFLHDALAALPDPHQPKAPFHTRALMNYQWGETLSFVASQQQHPINPFSLSGFTPPGAAGAYTIGPLAELRLRVPPATADMLLEVDAGAFLVDTRLPEQRVSISVNGHPAGEWLWKAGTPPHHELIIPQAWLVDGQVRLDFRVARPGSPRRVRVERGRDKVRRLFFHPQAARHGTIGLQFRRCHRHPACSQISIRPSRPAADSSDGWP